MADQIYIENKQRVRVETGRRARALAGQDTERHTTGGRGTRTETYELSWLALGSRVDTMEHIC